MGTIPFHRPARRFPAVVAEEQVKLASPPRLEDKKPGGISGCLMTVLPMVGMAAGMSMMFFFPTPIIIKIAMGGMVVMMPLASVFAKYVQTRQDRAKQQLEAQRYVAHLQEREVTLHQNAELQRASLERVHPDHAALWARALKREHLWERRAGHHDFLHLRLGQGKTPLLVVPKLDLGNDPMVQHVPELRGAATDLVERYTHLDDAPLHLDLNSLSSVALIGDPSVARAAVRSLICQLVVAHAPEDVSILAYFPPEAASEWLWLKWLPHARDQHTRPNGHGPACLLADSASMFSVLLQNEFQRREELIQQRADSKDRQIPALVVIIDGYQPRSTVATIPLVGQLLESGDKWHITVVPLVRDRSEEPTHVSGRIEIEPDGSFQMQQAVSGGESQHGRIDAVDVAAAEAIARSLAPLRLRDDTAQDVTSSSANLFEVLGVGSPDLVDPAQSWVSRPTQEVMRVPLGLRPDGTTLVLDLKEAAAGGMGPHGLVVGATGSGKSELLRTLVTGLAVSHSPDILSFVFVDFKGGAAFADLASLPHVAGLITNLQGDLSRVDRMYSALVGEQERRQNLLRDAGNVDGIKEYQALYARRPQMEPMPYLMIVVDEFGELLVARPDFLDLFNAIGRVGRSLGMHLLLASQRLEEGKIRGLEGHLRYRICLRTFSDADSKVVLGTGDAYRLPSTPGAGYFKVDTTVYDRFQTALVSAPYHGSVRQVDTAPESHLSMFTGVQQAPDPQASTATLTAVDHGQDDEPTEMEIAIKRLRDRSFGRMRVVHQVWLPTLEEVIPLDAVFSMAAKDWNLNVAAPRPLGILRVPIGILDKPAEQKQEPMVLDFSGVAGHLAFAGAPQSGKSTLLRTIISAFALTHSPEDVQFYCIDLGGGSLHSLEALPHVGAVCGKAERERTRRLIREIHSIVEERELLFRKHNIDSIANFRRRRMEGGLPPDVGGDVFLVIDNWAQLRTEFEDIDSDILPLLTTGLGYGVHVIISTPRWADIRSNLRDSIGARTEFRLNDPLESEMPRGAAKSLPAIPGRGLTAGALHFQTAVPRLDSAADAAHQQQALAQLVEAASRRWPGTQPATPVRLLPPVVRVADLPEARSSSQPGVPIGIEEFRLEPISLDLFSAEPHFLVFGDGESGKSNVLRLWMQQLARKHTPAQVQFMVVDYRRTLLDAGENDYLYSYAATPNLTKDAVDRLKSLLLERLPGPDVTRAQLQSRSWWQGPEYVIFVDDYDLVVSPSGNPLAALLELLPQGNDVGLHLVLARRVGGVARSAFEPILQRVRELGSPGLVMSGDPGEGPVLGTQRASLLPPGRGYLVRRGRRTGLIQIALADQPGH